MDDPNKLTEEEKKALTNYLFYFLVVVFILSLLTNCGFIGWAIYLAGWAAG